MFNYCVIPGTWRGLVSLQQEIAQQGQDIMDGRDVELLYCHKQNCEKFF